MQHFSNIGFYFGFVFGKFKNTFVDNRKEVITKEFSFIELDKKIKQKEFKELKKDNLPLVLCCHCFNPKVQGKNCSHCIEETII